MASTTSSPLSLSSTLMDGRTPRQSAATSSQCKTVPTLPQPPVHCQSHLWKTAAYCRKIARNVAAMATGEAPAAVATTTEAPTEAAGMELSDIVKTIQETWDKVEDKYAVTSLAVAGSVALWGSAGMISAIDRLPLVPGVLELVGIGYTGWFAYRNLVYKPERQALIQKIKGTYNDIIGSG